MAIFVSNASGAIGWPNLQPIQVHSSTEINFKLFQLKDLLKLWTQYSGTVVPLAMFIGPRSPGPIYVSGCHKLSTRPC